MLPSLLVLALAQPLDVSSVDSATTRVEQPGPARQPRTPVLDLGGLDEGDRAVFEALRERLVPAKERNAARPIGTQEPQLFAHRTVKGDEATWVLTLNRLQYRTEGSGCCPPCPCDGHNCAPCVACQVEGNCQSITSGEQVTATYTVVKRRLVRERIEVRPVYEAAQIGKPGLTTLQQPMRVTLERATPSASVYARALRSKAGPLSACLNDDPVEGRITLKVELDEGGKVTQAKVTSSTLPERVTACVLDLARRVRGSQRGEGPEVELTLRAGY